MDWSIALGILGIVVSVVVGWASYRFADRRSRNQKYRSAMSSVLQELSKSLGEDAIPTPAIIQATMRSVLRESGDPKIEIEVDEVLDDLMRQVTADPFLDGERRRKLQGDIETVRTEAKEQKNQAKMADRRQLHHESYSSLPSVATVVGVASTIVTAVALFGLSMRQAAESEPSSLYQLFSGLDPEQFEVFVLFAVMAPTVIFLILRLLDDDFIRRVMRMFRSGTKK